MPPRIASFVLPLGYSFNLDGSMMYMTFATIFIAQAYGIDLSLGQEITMLLVLMVTSKGMAGVPRASLVVIAATMSMFHIPEAGLLLILAVDHFLDMGRSATNVVGNAVASSVVARWEGDLDPEEPPDIEPPSRAVTRDAHGQSPRSLLGTEQTFLRPSATHPRPCRNCLPRLRASSPESAIVLLLIVFLAAFVAALARFVWRWPVLVQAPFISLWE